MGRTRKQETYTSDVEMELVASRQDISNTYYPKGGNLDDSGQEDLRRPLVEATKTAPGGGLRAPRIKMSVIADLKEFNGKDRDEYRVKIWISKVKTSFLRYQFPDERSA